MAQCSVDTYCRSGEHTECGTGWYCWPGVACNIQDMIEPTTSRPTMPPMTDSPTMDTPRPSRSPAGKIGVYHSEHYMP